MDAISHELRCAACGWVECCGPPAILRWLQSAGLLRRNKSADVAEQVELLRVTAPRLTCPTCGHTGLELTEHTDDDRDWPGTRRCADCNRPIDPERVDALPNATLCAACQGKEDREGGAGPVEYCPRCGSPMIVRRGGGTGITRYEQVCSDWPRCRGKA